MRNARPRRLERRSLDTSSRRIFLLRGASAVVIPFAFPKAAMAKQTLKFGLTPVFLTNDLELLAKLKAYLSRRLGRNVDLVQRRTYEEISGLLVSAQIDAAWICGYPFVAYRDQLSLVAVPDWQGKPLYRSYLIARTGRGAKDFESLRGDVHAFSDPNSNSGYLVTASLLAARRVHASEFFRQTFFTYGHRNVVRAVASGLAQSGSVDGYVWEVMRELEPELTLQTEIVRRSELLGFPPIACPRSLEDSEPVLALQAALVGMQDDAEGRDVLQLLRLDGFSKEQPSLFDTIAAELDLVRKFV